MVEITYKRRTEDHYKLDFKFWRVFDTDKVVTFENLDTGRYADGVLLELVDGNELRAVTQTLFSQMKAIKVAVEPPAISVIVKLLDNKLDSVFAPADFLNALCEAMDFDGTDQVNYPTWVGERGSNLCAFMIEKGHQPIDVLLNNAAKCFEGLDATLCAVSSPEGIVIYDVESIRALDPQLPPTN
jgi:hypothetical protein|nr:MAG TPA: hypothetical protein [Caudoviricetes sp.]